MKLRLRSLLFGLALAAPTTAHALAPINFIDQSASITGNYQWYSSWVWGVKFTPTHNNITGAAAMLFNHTSQDISTTLHIGVFDQFGNTLLGDVFAPITVLAGTSGMFGGNFASLINLTANTPYFLKFQTQDNDQLMMEWDYHAGVNGNSFYNANDGSWGASLPDGETDAAFEEYYQKSITNPDVVATPEPASLALLATGLVGVAGFARRRRRSL